MNLPNEIQIAIREAKKSMTNFGEPSLQSRLKVLRTLEDNSLTKHKNEGYYLRAKLALACAYKSIYIWDEYFSNDKVPHNIIKQAEKVFSNEIDLSMLEVSYHQVKTFLDDKFLLDEKYFRGIYAGFACWAAVGTIIYDNVPETEEESEVSLPPEDWDSSFYSSLAISNGAKWDKIGDVKARKEFWEWYFDIAISEVWIEKQKLS